MTSNIILISIDSLIFNENTKSTTLIDSFQITCPSTVLKTTVGTPTTTTTEVLTATTSSNVTLNSLIFLVIGLLVIVFDKKRSNK